ncbi:hypothetical protein ACOYR1_02790 [Thalassotalea piscium]
MVNNFLEIKELFESGTLYFDENFLTSKKILETKFLTLFPKSEYSTVEYQNSNQQGSVDCSELEFVFDDLHNLMDKLHTQAVFFAFEEVILKDGGVVNLGKFPKYYNEWLTIFEKLSSYSYSEPCKTYVFIEKKSVNTSTVLKVPIKDYSSDDITEIISKISDPSLLLASCLEEDCHQGERISTMKTSLTNLLNDPDFKLIDLISSADNLLNTFHRNYETYLRSFSFGEFIKDLEDDVGSFIDKVEEQIQGFYVQALAVPGAVILASAFRGADKGVTISLVFSAILAVTIVFISLKSKIKFITRITDNTLKKLKIYQKRTDDIENSAAKEAILEKVNNAIKSVEETSDDTKKDIFKMKDVIIGVGIMYLIATVLLGRM